MRDSYVARDWRHKVLSGDLKEYWVQQYFKVHYNRYGFSDFKGPFDSGPELTGKFNGAEAVIEIERFCYNYTQHGHHTNPRFDKVNYLVVLVKSSDHSAKDSLPEHIHFIEVEHFLEWYPKAARQYAMIRQDDRKFEILKDFFH